MTKTLSIHLAILLTLVLTAAAVAAPKAVPQEPVFTFTPVPEGQGMSHEFIIRNQGDTTLEITDVIPP